MKRRRPASEQRPVGGYLCRCGQRQGAHDGGKPGMPSKDGLCPGFLLGEERIVPDPHVAHRRMPFSRLLATCRPCYDDKLEWASQQDKSGHIYRAWLRIREYTMEQSEERG